MTTIISAFPLTLQNGTIADAVQVMSLLSWIQAQTNGNALASADVAASDGSALVGFIESGVGAVATTVQAKLRVFASDSYVESTLPCYGAVSVNRIRTALDRHAFEDWSALNTVDTALGYASFDAKPTMTNPSNQNHFAGYQARMIYNGAGALTNYMHGYDTDMSHTGAGLVTFAAGMHIRDIGGAGPITNNYGLYIDSLVRGGNAYSIYSVGPKHFFGGSIQTAGVNFSVDTVNKAIAYGFGTAGTANFGFHDFYDGKTTVIARVHYGGVVLSGGFSFLTDSASKELALGFGTSGTTNFGAVVFYDGKTTETARIDKTRLTLGVLANLKSYTFAALPVATNGDLAYCSNGRKAGEGGGAGTGVPVYYSTTGGWCSFRTDATVTA